MRYSLRTLLIVLAIGPPVLAATWWIVDSPLRPESFAEAFIGLMLYGLILLAIGGILVEERDSRQQTVRDKRKSTHNTTSGPT